MPSQDEERLGTLIGGPRAPHRVLVRAPGQVPGQIPVIPPSPATPPFNPNAPAYTVDSSGAGTPPPPGQYPTTQGQNPITRSLSKLRDPRVQAWLLSVAQGLAQPRGVGQTGVTNAIGALTSGYNTLGMAQQMQSEAERRYREEIRQQQQHEQGLRKGEVDIEAGQTGIEATKTGIEATKTGTEATRAKTAQLPALLKIEERGAATREGQLQLNKDQLEYYKTKDAATLAENTRQFEAQLAQEEKKLQVLIDKNANDKAISQLQAKTDAIRANAYASQAAATVKQMEEAGTLNPDTGAKLVTSATNDYRMSLDSPLSAHRNATDAEKNAMAQDYSRIVSDIVYGGPRTEEEVRGYQPSGTSNPSEGVRKVPTLMQGQTPTVGEEFQYPGRPGVWVYDGKVVQKVR